MDILKKISIHFTWKEAIWLPSWQRAATDSELSPVSVSNLEKLFKKMDAVRDYFGLPVNVHVAFRPEPYNLEIGGAAQSAHIYGMACDFDVQGMNCDDAKAKILAEGKLEEWGMRMEDNGAGANWLHLDFRAAGNGGRFFKP